MMVKIIPFSLLSLLLWLSPGQVAADSTAGPAPQVIPRVQLASVTPDSLNLVWRLQIADQWYLYGPYRNDTGFPPSVSLELPAGWTAGPLQFPAPQRKVLPGGILDHVYFGELVLTQTLATGGNPAPAAGLTANLFWLACRDLCVPGQATLTVPVTDPDPEAAALRQTALAARPTRLPAGTVQIERDAETITLEVAGASELVLIPAETGPLLVDLLQDGSAAGPSLTLRLRPGQPAQEPLTGLLLINHKDGRRQAGTISIP